MLRCASWSGGWLLAILLAAPAAADTLEEAEKKLVEAYGKLKSYTATFKATQDMEMGGMRVKSVSQGTTEWLRRGEKVLYRVDVKNVMERGGDEPADKMETSATMIVEGDVAHTLSEAMGQKQAMKMKAEPAMVGDPKARFEALRKDWTLKLLPDEKVDGADCYVVEATPKEGSAGGPLARQVTCFRKDMGVDVKSVGFDATGKQLMTSTVSDLKLNAEIKPERFEFKAPEGVQVMDMTKQP